MPETGVRRDPYRAYTWRLEVGGEAQAYFTACTGLGVSIDVIKFREAGARQIVRSLPGQVTYEPVTLSYGLTPSQDMYLWLMSSVEGRVERRNASIIMLNSDGNETGDSPRWNLEDAWVAAWRGATLDTMSPGLAIESVTLVFDRLTRV